MSIPFVPHINTEHKKYVCHEATAIERSIESGRRKNKCKVGKAYKVHVNDKSHEQC